jgi:hypothetical protein
MTVSGEDVAREAAGQLEALAKDLEPRGFAVRLVNVGEYAGIRVAHRVVSQLSETVHAGPAGDGRWWFWWSWADPIAPVSDVQTAAFKIAYVLTPQANV